VQSFRILPGSETPIRRERILAAISKAPVLAQRRRQKMNTTRIAFAALRREPGRDRRSQQNWEAFMRRIATLAAGFVVAGMAAGSLAAAAEAGNPLAEAVRAATEKYNDPAVAIADGYVPMPCVSGPGSGAMGIHFVKPAHIEDGVIDIARPEALMFEPQPDGSLELVGVEFITFTGPTVLMGHLFHFVDAPNRYGLDPFYELHVWAWRENPSGTFADFNTTVSCDAMNAEAHMAH
jgi:hypothetical protein